MTKTPRWVQILKGLSPPSIETQRKRREQRLCPICKTAPPKSSTRHNHPPQLVTCAGCGFNWHPSRWPS
jgi:NMD protein affecting ribosome stability and mRNA decay